MQFRSKQVRVIVGLAVWMLIAAGAVWWSVGGDRRLAASADVGREVLRYAAGRRRGADLRFEDRCLVATGDPIFVMEDGDRVSQVGQLAVSAKSTKEPRFEAIFYADSPAVDASSYITYHETPESLEWVLKTMLPEAKRRQVIDEIADAFERHHGDVIEALRPIMQDSLRDSLAVIEQDLPAAIQRHRAELAAIANRYDDQVVANELIPLVKEEVWPIVRKHAEPTATEVGQEMWQRVSIWRFGWRYVYDRSVLPKKDLTRKEWDRFLEDEAMPVLESHTDDFIDVQKQILAEVIQNPKVRESIRTNLERVIDDPEIRHIMWQIIREVIVENPRVKAVIDKHWRSPRAKAAFQLASAKLEPTAVRIGELLFGSKEDGISPEFARVLRNQILGKDRRWFVLHVGDVAKSNVSREKLVLNVRRGSSPTLNPFVTATDGIRTD